MKKPYLLTRKKSISVSLTCLYIVVLLVSWTIIFTFYNRITNQTAMKSSKVLVSQSINMIGSNLDTLFTETGFCAKLIMTNQDIQEILKNKNLAGYSSSFRTVKDDAVPLIDTVTEVDGVYLFDNFGNCYSADKQYIKTPNIESIQEAKWYEEVLKQDGNSSVILNASKIFQNYRNENIVSVIRIVNDTTNYSNIGTIMVNMNQNAIDSCLKGVMEEQDHSILILDQYGNPVVSDGTINKNILQKLPENAKEINYKGKSYIGRSLKLSTCDWTVYLAIPFTRYTRNYSDTLTILFVSILLIGLFAIISYRFVSILVVHPVKALVKAMENVKQKNFPKADFEPRVMEMEVLRDSYNYMVNKMEQLIEQIYEEMRDRRQAELKAMQEQMKPHFLYNTIDAISYLALAGKNDELYDALEAFGEYYRIILSKGREIITVKEEMRIIKDYLKLQEIRYGDELHYIIKMDPEIASEEVLKLILQPLVENSISHGIKPKPTPGMVYVAAEKKENTICFTIEDDGVGMDPDLLDKITGPNLANNERSFGLRDTIDRLKMFYGDLAFYEIESKPGFGTKILIYVPFLQKEEIEND